MPAEPADDKPIALIVEDQPATLERRRKMFHLAGFQSVGAASLKDALREFRAIPTIDILVTDINLEESSSSDKSGVELARLIREKRPGMPVMALSGHFDSLTDDDRVPFNAYILKGGNTASQLTNCLREWKEQALNYRCTRMERARSELERMRQSNEVPEPEVEALRDFLPGRHTASAGTQDADPMLPEEMLRQSGWHLQLVEAGFQVKDSTHGMVRTACAVPIWIRRRGTEVHALLHGHSSIRHDADREEEAVAGVLQHMYGRRILPEFQSPAPESLNHEMRQLREYLYRIFP